MGRRKLWPYHTLPLDTITLSFQLQKSTFFTYSFLCCPYTASEGSSIQGDETTSRNGTSCNRWAMSALKLRVPSRRNNQVENSQNSNGLSHTWIALWHTKSHLYGGICWMRYNTTLQLIVCSSFLAMYSPLLCIYTQLETELITHNSKLMRFQVAQFSSSCVPFRASLSEVNLEFWKVKNIVLKCAKNRYYKGNRL